MPLLSSAVRKVRVYTDHSINTRTRPAGPGLAGSSIPMPIMRWDGGIRYRPIDRLSIFAPVRCGVYVTAVRTVHAPVRHSICAWPARHGYKGAGYRVQALSNGVIALSLLTLPSSPGQAVCVRMLTQGHSEL